MKTKLTTCNDCIFIFASGGIKVVQAPLSVDFVGVDKIHRAEPVNSVIMGIIVTGASPISGRPT